MWVGAPVFDHFFSVNGGQCDLQHREQLGVGPAADGQRLQ